MSKLISFVVYACAFLIGYVCSIPLTLFATGMPVQIQTFEHNQLIEIKTWKYFENIYYPVADERFPAIVIPYYK